MRGRSRSPSRSPTQRRRLSHSPARYKDNKLKHVREPKKPKEKPNFDVSGKLKEEAHTFRGVVLKYCEPPESRMPKEKWSMFIFKGKEQVDQLPIHRQSAYLIGRDRLVADIPIDHPSCSKQHAALQYRKVEIKNQSLIKLYIIDLESANTTKINGEAIEPQKYYEIKPKDVIQFGSSTRDYVFLPDDYEEK